MKFDGLMVYVSDMGRAVSFYRDVLGLPLEMESPGWSQFDLGSGNSLGLHPARGGSSPQPGFVPGFSVDDIAAAKQRLTSGGAAIAQDFHDIPGGVVMGVTDPDGNHINVTQMGVSCADLGVVSH